MNVSDAVKAKYRNNSRHKNLVIRFPLSGLQINHKNLHQNSMRLKESVLDKESIEFVGCIPSIFQVNIENLSEDVKGKKIEVELFTDDYPDDAIPMFHGIVDSAVKQANKTTKEIVAYDELYTKGNINVSAWYKALKFPITLKDVRDSLFEYVGLNQAEADLPNDGVQIKKQYNPSSLQAIAVMKAICQINGAFGIINRQGDFEYRILNKKLENKGTFPGELYPPFYPSVFGSTEDSDVMNPDRFAFYKKVDYEEYTVKPVDMITIRDSEESDGVVYMESGSTGTNNYIIQGNMFTYGLPADVLLDMAARIYKNVSSFTYTPFSSVNTR